MFSAQGQTKILQNRQLKRKFGSFYMKKAATAIRLTSKISVDLYLTT
jgi:hypothetical protein